MTPPILRLALFSIITAAASPAQTYTDTTAPLVIAENENISESYVNRTTDGITSSVKIDPGASYTGHNVNITHHDDPQGGSGQAIHVEQASLTLTADEGTWNTITINSNNTTGIYFSGGKGSSFVSNTKIHNSGHYGAGIYAYNLDAPLLLDNVEIHLSNTTGSQDTGGGLWATYATITNKNADGTINRGVTITSDHSGEAIGALITNFMGAIDLYNSTIDIRKVRPTEALLSAHYGTTISLTDSAISSGLGNSLAMTSTRGHNTINLNNVNLDNAKGQTIKNDTFRADASEESCLTVNLANGTNFDGYATVADALTVTNINIETDASWNVTGNSDLGSGTLTLDATSTISFTSESGDFTNIHAAAVMLASGAILQLDRDAAWFGTERTITLFTLAETDKFANLGIIILDSNGTPLAHRDNGDGTFTIFGIPEPSTAALGFIALCTLTLRRRTTA